MTTVAVAMTNIRLLICNPLSNSAITGRCNTATSVNTFEPHPILHLTFVTSNPEELG